MGRLALVAATVAIAATALTACSNGGSSSGGSTSGTSGASTAKVGLLLPDSVTARYAAADRPYFTAKMKSLCPKCSVLYANADADPAKQQQQAQSMLTQGAKVLVLDPQDGEAAAAIVAAAKQKNVPVVSYDRLIDSADLSYYISFDNQKVGQLQATALVDKLHADGVPAGSGILMVNGAPTDPNAAQFKAGAHSVIDKSGYKVLAEYDTIQWLPSNAQSWAASQITKFGTKIKGIYAANDGTAGGVVAAEKSGNFTPVPLTGQDAQLSGIQNILAGTQYMTVYKAVKPEAEDAAQMAWALLNGKSWSGATTTVSPKNGGTVKAELLQPVAVTAGNIESTVVKDQFYGSDSAAQICTAAYTTACTKNGIK
ncbi:MAG TPA: substrate-binding domain-containing protein [Microbacterium sp.]|uniref:substrate-binding domain-containing protein n=1 Tax=Microbacterium sp. TaxID=51671 RepID=UPI002B486486|nr:substrate-binding domain-containing protein [Microbacterium sp.]HKT56790.1 substrate-binding domain-containing protein [Microbacterium sp.]